MLHLKLWTIITYIIFKTHEYWVLKKYRSFLLTVFDIVIVLVSYLVALWLRLGFSLREITYFHHLVWLSPIIIVTCFRVLKLAKTDSLWWALLSFNEALRVFMTSILGILLCYLFVNLSSFPFTVKCLFYRSDVSRFADVVCSIFVSHLLFVDYLKDSGS